MSGAERALCAAAAALLLLLLLLLCAAPPAAASAPRRIARTFAAAERIDGAVQWALYPSYVAPNGGFVSVTVDVTQSAHAPAAGDFVAVFSPTSAVNGSAPLKYALCNSSAAYLSTGRASLRFWLINYRNDYVFALYGGTVDAPVLLSVSPRVFQADTYHPSGAHLALDARGELLVTWVARANADAAPTLLWGESPQRLGSKAAARVTSFTRAQLCGGFAAGAGWHDPGYVHTASFGSALRPGVRYYYRFGDATSFSEVKTFVAPPTLGSAALGTRRVAGAAESSSLDNVTILVYGDMGKNEIDGTIEHWMQPGSLGTAKQVALEVDKGAQLIYHIGDISYAVGYESQWDEFLELIAPFASRVPYMTLIGNHERDWPGSGDRYATANDSNGECGVPYETYFPMPTSQPDKHWYSFEFGALHVLGISTEHAFDPSSEQYSFVLNDLASVNRTRTPFVVVAGHRPMFIDSTYDGPEDSDLVVARALQAALDPMLAKYRVDLAFWGHHHSYQRTCPLVQGSCADPSVGTVHVVVGTAGFEFSTNIQPTQPAIFEVVDDAHYGIVRLSAGRDTLRSEFVHNDDGLVYDTLTIAAKVF